MNYLAIFLQMKFPLLFFGENETFFLDEFRNGILIETEFDVKNLINRLTSFFNTDALPFFEKWKDLNVLYEYIKDKTEREELLLKL